MSLFMGPLVPKRGYGVHLVSQRQGVSSLQERLSLVPSDLTLCPPTLLLGNEGRRIRARTASSPTGEVIPMFPRSVTILKP